MTNTSSCFAWQGSHRDAELRMTDAEQAYLQEAKRHRYNVAKVLMRAPRDPQPFVCCCFHITYH